MSTFLLQIHSLQLLDEQQQSTQPWLPLLRQQHLFPSPTPSMILISNSPTTIICFGMCRWSRKCLVNESFCLLTARLYGPLRMICPVLFLLPLLASILALPQCFWLGNNKISLSLSTLLSSLSIDALYLVVDCPTSASVWSTLEHALASPSNSRIIQLHGSLQDLQQGDNTVTLCLQHAKGLFDELAAAGRPISFTDFNLVMR